MRLTCRELKPGAPIQVLDWRSHPVDSRALQRLTAGLDLSGLRELLIEEIVVDLVEGRLVLCTATP